MLRHLPIQGPLQTFLSIFTHSLSRTLRYIKTFYKLNKISLSMVQRLYNISLYGKDL